MSEVSVSEKRVKEPLVKISKRDGHKWYHSVLLNVGAVATALIIGGIFIAALGYNPFTFYAKIIVGNFSNAYYLRALVAIFVPLLITALGLSAAFKMKLWNIGAEGQFVMGALTATTVALLLNDSLPRPWGVIIVGAAGAAGGGLYGMLVAVFKAKFNTNETLLTLMLNYIAVYIVQYFEKTDFFKRASNGIPAFKRIDEAVWLTKIQIGNFYFDTAL
ncbi:MAG: ABC transporter permease, partial [Clostridiales bacterium]|nr:ABC transporter permease [Clostridiales bacterium]